MNTTTPPDRHRAAYTLVELLVTVVIIVILGSITFGGYHKWVQFSGRAVCANNLRLLGSAVNLYLGDYDNFYPPYVTKSKNGRMWYFGEETSPAGTAEGNRQLDRTAGPLYPYIEQVGKIEVCRAFNYGSALWKPKFKGASYGYGYNWILGGRMTGKPLNVSSLRSQSGVILFGDCGQVNTFQAPASKSNPMIEEFYIINETDKTVHFRHGGRANILFADGHVESFKPYPGTVDSRMTSEVVGRITKAGSMEMLR